MDIKQIRALAEIFAENGLTRLEVTEGEASVCMEKQTQPAVISAPQETLAQGIVASPMAEIVSAPAAEPVDFNRVTEVKSPMVGVFYAAASPDAPPFVKRGDKVKRGDVLCIIEAMKLLNEITAEMDGEIADICVENGQVVEFSQTMFKIC